MTPLDLLFPLSLDWSSWLVTARVTPVVGTDWDVEIVAIQRIGTGAYASLSDVIAAEEISERAVVRRIYAAACAQYREDMRALVPELDARAEELLQLARAAIDASGQAWVA